jgi:hypothetical protein
MAVSGPVAGGARCHVPGSGWGRRPAAAAFTAVAASVVAGTFGGVMAVLFSDPAATARHPARGYLWCAGFAAVATVACALAVRARGRPVPAVVVVCGLAMWALLPITAFLAFFVAQVAGVVVIAVAAPLLLAGAAWILALRGRLARATGLLLVAVFAAAGGTALGSPVLPAVVWLPVVLWQLALAVAAIAALRRATGHDRISSRPADLPA